MKIWQRVSALLAVVGLASLYGVLNGGCGGAETLCDQALDKVQQCGFQNTMLNDTGDECEAISQCAAKCLLDADCGEIMQASENTGPVVTCAAKCG
jgi:hypothetical protein